MSKIQVDSIVNKDDTGAPDFPNGATVSGIVTATSFTGNLTGDATGLSGSPTLSGITSVSTTNLTVNGNAYPNGGPLSNRNIVINGAMQVAQRGTSSTSSGVVTVDRFTSSWGGGAVTTTQESLTSGSPYNEGFRNYARLTNTTGATGASNYRELFYKIEAQDLANSGWNYTSSSSYVTISFWIRSSVSQDYYFFLESKDGSNQIYSSPFTLSADTWTKVTKTIPGGASVQIDNDADLGALFTFIAFYGTDFTDSGNTDETWRARDGASKFTLDMTNTWANTNGATFDVTGVQLEVGSVATPFEHRSYGDELARCQRYYWNLLLGKGQTDVYLGNAAQYSSAGAFMVLHPPVTMRTEPSLDVSNGTAHFATLVNETVTDFSTWNIDGRNSAAAFTVSATVSGTAGNALFTRSQNTSAKFAFSAEL